MSTRPISGNEPHTHRVAQREEPSFFSSTRKVIGLAGTLFFALGALVMDPVLLIPAGICAVLTFDINCMDLFSAICSALTSSRSATRSMPREAIVIHPSYMSTGSSGASDFNQHVGRHLLQPTPLVTATVHTARGGGYVAMPEVRQAFETPTTVHTTRGGGYVAVPNPQQGHQTQYGLGDVGLNRNPTPQVSPLPQGTTSDRRSRRTVDDSSSLAGPRVPRGGGTTSQPVQRDQDGVALQPTLHTRRGGGLTTGTGL